MPVNPSPLYRCLFCGAPSRLHPRDQRAPADYCGEMHHGDPEVSEASDEDWEEATRPGDLWLDASVVTP